MKITGVELRKDLTHEEILSLNKDDKCKCGHLDLFHDREVGLCLIEGCNFPGCNFLGCNLP